MLVNLINISYCAMKILPYQDAAFSKYRSSSAQDFRFELSEQIRQQVFFASSVENIENHIRSDMVTKALGTVQKLLVTRTPYKCPAAKKKIAGIVGYVKIF